MMLVACSASGSDAARSRMGAGTRGGSTGAAPGSGPNTPASGAAGNMFVVKNANPAGVFVKSDADGTLCKGLQCQQHICGNVSTTISGRVYDPAGKNPLYNVAVYIPNEAVEPLKPGASCDPCAKIYTGKAVASALTDANGDFTIPDAPDGANIPLVLQIGKWRKQMTLPNVSPCQDNVLPDKTLTLPRNHMEGDIPSIAISTGGADTLECLLRRIGVDASEYTPGDNGDARIHIYRGAGTMQGGFFPGLGGGGPAPDTSPSAPSSPDALWNSTANLMKYDILLLSCEGQETEKMNQQALHDYASAGGRVFASHFHYSWFNSGPYSMEDLAIWSAGSNPMDDIQAEIVTTFPKGQALQQWLTNTNALTNGKLPIEQARHNADVGPEHTVSQAWIVADQQADPPGATQYFSFNTPTDAAMSPDGPNYCGRVVFSDLHVGGASMDMPMRPVPQECADAELTPQEKALEFMLFDLSACITPDDRIPKTPVSPM